jgi:hypothetical protein
MATQGQRQDYMWRPNDNSSTTITRYEQEAEHWLKALKNAELKYAPINWIGSLGLIFLPITFIFGVLLLIGLYLKDLYDWLNGTEEESQYYEKNGILINRAFLPKKPVSDDPPMPTREELREMFKDLIED